MLLDLLRANGSIIVNKKLARAIGMDAAVMYSELISKQQYFSEKHQLTEEGFFFNTVKNMEADTTLTKHQQSKAIKKLVELKLIQHKNRGLPQKRYFKVNEDETIIADILGTSNLTSISKKTELLEVEKVHSNNNKYNNNDLNNTNIKIKSTNSIYLISKENEVFAYYSQKYKDYFSRDHPSMNEVKIKELITNFNEIRFKLEIDKDKWFDLIDYHFDNLSIKNNGNILSFLSLNDGDSCVLRYLNNLDL